MKRILTFILLFLAIAGFATWQYRLLCILAIVLINKSKICEWTLVKKYKHGYSMIVAILCFCIWIAMPNYFQRGRTQLIYLDSDGNKTHVPLSVYALNILFPEEEDMNVGMKSVAVMPPMRINILGHHLGGRLLRDAQKDFWTLKGFGFYSPYNRLSMSGSNPGTFTIGQTWNEMFGDKLNAIYITKPTNYDSNKKYPVVFFAHGFLGSWELYNGLLDRLDNCFVVVIATRTLSGIFTHNDIAKCFTQYIPYMKSEGYNIDETQLHLMGLSNGGTAADVAFHDFSNKLASITYISTGCHVTKHTKAKILMIGGGKDESSANLPDATEILRSHGTNAAIFWDKDENHYIMVHKINEIIDFINKELRLNE